jgi:hypothetical protein
VSGQSESAVNRVVSLTDDRERVVSLHNSASWKSQSKLRQNVKTSSSQPMARHRGDDTDAGSSKAQSSSGGQKTDFPEMATNDDAFDGLKNVLGSAEYERAHKPYAPLPKGESIPSMQKLWAHAMRRYGRYQGYAWAGVLGTGALAFGLATATKENAGGAEKKGG